MRREGRAGGRETNNGRGGGGGIVDGKTGGSAPTEFFGGITDLYFTPDLPSDVYVFNILDAPVRACVRPRTSASMPNAQRSTNSYPAPLFPLPPFVFPSSSLISALSSHFYTNPRFFIRFSLSLFLFLFLSHSPLPRVPSTFSCLFREFSRLFSCSLRDSLKSFSLCFSAIHFPE